MVKINSDQIISIISKHIKVSEKKIDINSKSSDFFQWDSLAQVNIVLEIEKQTNTKISSSKMSELTSVKSIINHLK